jgi:hypothetical protein
MFAHATHALTPKREPSPREALGCGAGFDPDLAAGDTAAFLAAGLSRVASAFALDVAAGFDFLALAFPFELAFLVVSTAFFSAAISFRPSLKKVIWSV